MKEDTKIGYYPLINHEIRNLIDEEDIVKYVKAQKIKMIPSHPRE